MSNNIRERFRERKFSFLNKKKKKKEKEKIEEENKKKEDESILKIVAFSPLILFGFIKNIIDYFSSKSNVQDRKIILKKEAPKKINIKKSQISLNKKYVNKENTKKTINNSKILNNKINKQQQQKSQLKSNNFIVEKSKGNDSNIDNIDNIDNIELSILLKIKKKINKLNDECDIIESEAYLIKKYGNDKNLLENAIAIRKEIETLEEKLNNINNNLDNIKEKILLDPKSIDDDDIVETIIKYKEAITDIEESKLPNKIKLLEEYKSITIKLEELDITTKNLEQETKVREEELSKRDNRYNIAKEKMINLNEINERCNDIINNNKIYLDELSSKIGIINKTKYTKYKLQGLNNLLTTSLKYIGLLSLTPLKGILPGIAAKTFATRKLVGSMYHNLHYEKQEKIVYSFENYYSQLNSKLSNINAVEENISLALQDINKLKSEFRNSFLKYNLPEYNEAYKKIELLEEDVLSSRQKVFLMKNKIIQNQKTNKETLKKVRKLNSNK